MRRILHLGNIANNAYANAKHLNVAGPYAHRAISYDNPHVMAYPEWDEADADVEVAEYWPDWSGHNVRRPDWFLQVGVGDYDLRGRSLDRRPLRAHLWTLRRKLAYWLKDQGVKKSGRGYAAPKGVLNVLRASPVVPFYLAVSFATQVLQRLQRSRVTGTSSVERDYRIMIGHLSEEFARADLVQGYGPDVIAAYLSGKPFVAYEHGTLRDMPFDGTPAGKLLADAYKAAEHVFITNPDTHASAKKLGLKNFSFTPHSVEMEVFTPGTEPELRADLGLTDDNLVVIAPARQNWDIKRNDRLIEAFRILADNTPRARLLICDWGQHRDLTRDLVRRLGLSGHVQYYRPVPKRRSATFLRAADIVVDQMLLPTFGALSPEAMACGKATLTSYDPKLNDWCFASPPPIIPITDVKTLAADLIALAHDPERRIALGQAGRAWVSGQYSVDRLTQVHNEVFAAVFARMDEQKI